MEMTIRRRKTAATLALTVGISGLHRLYLGQYVRAWLYLSYPMALVIALAYATGTLDIVREQTTLSGTEGLQYLFLPLLVIPLFDAWWFFRMSDAHFQARYPVIHNSHSRLLYILFTLFLGITFNLLSYTLVFTSHRPDTGGRPEVTCSTDSLGAAYSREGASWQGRVVRVTGTLLEEEVEFTESGERHSWIVGPSPIPILCRIHPDASSATADWQAGQTKTLQGWVEADLSNKIILEDCRPIP